LDYAHSWIITIINDKFLVFIVSFIIATSIISLRDLTPKYMVLHQLHVTIRISFLFWREIAQIFGGCKEG
jgi:hypothetical protein